MNVFSAYPGSEIFNDLVQAGKVKLDDNYFLGLTSMYSDFTKTDLITFNDDMTPRELALWRLAFMLTGYFVGYVLYPSRIVRTLRNVLFPSNEAATVLEHRLRDALHKFKGLATGKSTPSAPPPPRGRRRTDQRAAVASVAYSVVSGNSSRQPQVCEHVGMHPVALFVHDDVGDLISLQRVERGRGIAAGRRIERVDLSERPSLPTA